MNESRHTYERVTAKVERNVDREAAASKHESVTPHAYMSQSHTD